MKNVMEEFNRSRAEKLVWSAATSYNRDDAFGKALVQW